MGGACLFIPVQHENPNHKIFINLLSLSLLVKPVMHSKTLSYQPRCYCVLKKNPNLVVMSCQIMMESLTLDCLSRSDRTLCCTHVSQHVAGQLLCQPRFCCSDLFVNNTHLGLLMFYFIVFNSLLQNFYCTFHCRLSNNQPFLL